MYNVFFQIKDGFGKNGRKIDFFNFIYLSLFFCYKINNITYGAFENMVQLQNLDLSGNDLKYIPSGAFIGMICSEFVNALFCFITVLF